MQDLIEYIAKSLASKPDEVKVTAEMEDDRLILRLEVAEEDKGKIIGRQGRVVTARDDSSKPSRQCPNMSAAQSLLLLCSLH